MQKNNAICRNNDFFSIGNFPKVLSGVQKPHPFLKSKLKISLGICFRLFISLGLVR